jgi:hypothetical protein
VKVFDGEIAPPFVEVAVLVEEPPFVVKAVCQFVTDDDANATVAQTSANRMSWTSAKQYWKFHYFGKCR